MTLIAVLVVAFSLMGLTLYFVLRRGLHKVQPGFALVISGTRGTRVSFKDTLVLPILERAEPIDIRLKTLILERRGNEGLICKDNIRADIHLHFQLQIGHTAEDILEVAQSIGCQRASDPDTLADLFLAKFSEAVKTVGKSYDFAELVTQRTDFVDKVLATIGSDLNGYLLEDAAIDQLDQTPLENLDRNNILDAQGIKKITALTQAEKELTERIERGDAPDLVAAALPQAQALADYQRGGFEARPPIDYDALLPAPQEHTDFGDALRLDGHLLTLTAASTSLDLDAPFSTQLSRGSEPTPKLFLELRQSRPGVKLSLVLSAPLQDTLDDAGIVAASTLPELHQRAIALPPDAMRRLLAHLRFVDGGFSA